MILGRTNTCIQNVSQEFDIRIDDKHLCSIDEDSDQTSGLKPRWLQQHVRLRRLFVHNLVVWLI